MFGVTCNGLASNPVAIPQGGGGTPACKWRGWSNRGKIQDPKKSLSLPTLPNKIPGPKITPKKIPCQIAPKLPGGTITLKFDYSLYHKYAKAAPRHFSSFLILQKSPVWIRSPQKNTCQIFQPKKIPESKISNPKKSFDHPHHLQAGVPPRESNTNTSADWLN